MAENRLGWKQSKRAPAVIPENSEIRARCLTEITFQLPKLQIWLNVSVTACLLLFIQAPTKLRQMKAFVFQTKRERTKIHKKLSGEGNWRRFPLYGFIEMYHLSPKALPAQPHIPTQLSDTYLHKRNGARGPGPWWGWRAGDIIHISQQVILCVSGGSDRLRVSHVDE